MNPVSMGLLYLSPNGGEWAINQTAVDTHVRQLSKQLAKTDSILSWIQTWNSCIGLFFSDTFGKPANWFGPNHFDAIIST